MVIITDDDGKPVDPSVEPTEDNKGEPETTMPPTTMSPTTMPPTTMSPTTMSPTTMPPTTMSPTTLSQTTMPPAMTTQAAPPTTVPPITTEGQKDDTTDYGDYGGDYQTNRRRRNTFGAGPPSTAVDSELLVVTNSRGAGQLFAFVNGVPVELTVIQHYYLISPWLCLAILPQMYPYYGCMLMCVFFLHRVSQCQPALICTHSKWETPPTWQLLALSRDNRPPKHPSFLRPSRLIPKTQITTTGIMHMYRPRTQHLSLHAYYWRALHHHATY